MMAGMGTNVTNKTNKRARTYARNRAAAVSRRGRRLVVESDSTYFLKLVIVLILGTLWIKHQQPLTWMGVPFGAFPLGMVLGVAGVHLFERDQMNRKIWYAVLAIVTVISYFLPAGIILS